MTQGASKKIDEIKKQLESLYDELAKISVESDITVYLTAPGSYHGSHVVTKSEYERLLEDIGQGELQEGEPLLDSNDQEITVGRWIASSALCW